MEILMKNELKLLREAMQRESIDAYLITMDDDHQSEYVGDHYKEIRFISGFTGSAGKLVVTAEDAGLWTDGRYFVQAEAELKDSGIRLMRMGRPETPDIMDYICDSIVEGGRLGFCGSCVSFTEAKELKRRLSRKQAHIVSDIDLPGEFWKDRPMKASKPVFILEDKYAGESASDKLKRLKSELCRLGARSHVITSLDDIAWLLNLRGDDVAYNPVFRSFMLFEGDSIRLYIDKGHLSPEIESYIKGLGIGIDTEEEHFYQDVRKLKEGPLLLESGKINALCGLSIPEGMELIDRMMPTTLMKARKNKTEMANLKKAHLKDGLSLTRFMYWFKENVSSGRLTEWGCVEKLHEFRAANESFLGESFSTISAYGANAAMCHYSPSKEHDTAIEPKGLYLVDSGGQYLEGTTDVTRTWSCGPVTDEERTSLTLSVIANMRLADARFLEGTGGAALDYIAREPFWRRGLNFDHGTGHGVGYLLNVHERPVGIRYKAVPERQDQYPFAEGMYVSDEPGLYIEGSHGVRTENMLMCMNDHKNAYGQFCRFEAYTLCPIDKYALDTSIMEKRDIELFNAYHAKVYKELSPYMEGDELSWLKDMCEPL